MASTASESALSLNTAWKDLHQRSDSPQSADFTYQSKLLEIVQGAINLGRETPEALGSLDLGFDYMRHQHCRAYAYEQRHAPRDSQGGLYTAQEIQADRERLDARIEYESDQIGDVDDISLQRVRHLTAMARDLDAHPSGLVFGKTGTARETELVHFENPSAVAGNSDDCHSYHSRLGAIGLEYPTETKPLTVEQHSELTQLLEDVKMHFENTHPWEKIPYTSQVGSSYCPLSKVFRSEYEQVQSEKAGKLTGGSM